MTIQIDGSHGEAGGQIIRTAVAFSAVTGKPCRITNIRKGRPQPGLKAQHLRGIEAVAQLCNANTKGLNMGSIEIEFIPGPLSHKHLSVDVGTAGSVTLILQSLLIPAIHTKEELVFEITGGTNVKWSPTVEYFQRVFCHYMEMMGIDIHIDVLNHGFYPKGNGKVKVTVKPSQLIPINLTERKGEPKIHAWSVASEELKKANVAERQIEGTKLDLESKNIIYDKTHSIGSSLDLCAVYGNCVLGANFLGERSIKAENVGEKAASLLKKQLDSDSCLDEWMADQLLPYMALSGGESKVSVTEVTKHAETNIWVIEKFLPVKFSVDSNTITCRPK